MSEIPTEQITHWQVDYQDGRIPRDVAFPHAWRQDLELSEEGPVFYRTELKVPKNNVVLRFWGVSYQAQVFIDGQLQQVHEGMWDMFEVPLREFRGRSVQVEVRVVKNGGPTFPVKDVLSGFLPFVFHTFGGIYKRVEMGPALAAKPSSAQDDDKIYFRGLLHWGWYPDLGHQNPSSELIRKEVLAAKSLGFNTVKFCLWVPPHEYLEILQEEGMHAWLELPLWDPTGDAEKQASMVAEIERIVLQYRHHASIRIWTVGCELSQSTPPELRSMLVQLVRNLTGCSLVKDNSGGAEMYGGDLREFGTFDDFHPYCETPFYPEVLDSLLPGPRESKRVLLGEFNDIDAHRDLPRIEDRLPYWASALRELNDQGVRWQHDLPRIMRECRFVHEPRANRHAGLMESSRQKALFVRKTVQEMVRARSEIEGYVITGWRDTPISTAGFFDDWGSARYRPEEVLPWNGECVVFPIPIRRPPWINGGNRAGYLDPFVFFSGQVFVRLGVHSEKALLSGLTWQIVESAGNIVHRGCESLREVPAMVSTEVAQISWTAPPGEYALEVRFGETSNRWPITVFEKYQPNWPVTSAIARRLGVAGGEERGLIGVGLEPAINEWIQEGGRGIVFLEEEGTLPMPFWRESAYEFLDDDFWAHVPFRDRWDRFWGIAPDCAIDMSWLESKGLGGGEILMNRIDVRTYAEHPMIVRLNDTILTTLRPWGGLGAQPAQYKLNPSGHVLLASLIDVLGGA